MPVLHEPDGKHRRITAAQQRAIKALGNDPVHKMAVDFIIYTLCGRHRASFIVDVPHSTETTAWLEGRRYVGEKLARMIERPIQEDPPEPDPRAITATEQQRRHNRITTQG